MTNKEQAALITKQDEEDQALMLAEMEQEAGQGQEEVGQQDLILPSLSIVQSLSNCKNPRSEIYNPDAEEGMIYHNVSRQVTPAWGEQASGGIIVVPAYYRKVHLEYDGPGRDARYLTQHHADTPLLEQVTRTEVGEKVVDMLPDKHILVTVARHYVWVPAWNEPVIIPMRSTALQASRLWNTKINRLRVMGASGKEFIPALYTQEWRLTTTLQSGSKGDSYNWVTDHIGTTTSLDCEMARDFYSMLRSSAINVVADDRD